MQDKIILKSIQAIGLSEVSGQVYLALFKLENPSITDIAKNLSQHRTKIYESLDELVKADLITPDKTKKCKYSLVSPSSLMVGVMAKKTEYELISQKLSQELPLFETYFHKSKPNESILKLYEGEDEANKLIFEMYNQVMDEVLFMGDVATFQTVIGVLRLEQLAKLRTKRGVAIKIIGRALSRYGYYQASKNKEFKREVRVMDSSFESFGSFNIFGSKVVIWNTIAPRGILIEDEVVADFFRNIFNMAWKVAKEE